MIWSELGSDSRIITLGTALTFGPCACTGNQPTALVQVL
jgi:hypothetical protein